MRGLGVTNSLEDLGNQNIDLKVSKYNLLH